MTDVVTVKLKLHKKNHNTHNTPMETDDRYVEGGAGQTANPVYYQPLIISLRIGAAKYLVLMHVLT